MSVSVWLVILVPLLLLGWLVSQAMPTPRDRQLQTLRGRARALDLTVTLRSLDDPDPAPAERVSSSGRPLEPKLSVAGYARALRPPSGLLPRAFPQWRVWWLRNRSGERHDEALPPGWRFDARDHDLPLVDAVTQRLGELLQQVPEGTHCVEATGREVTLYWRERGDASEVDAIGAFLDGLRAFQIDLAERAGAEGPEDAADDADAREDAAG